MKEPQVAKLAFQSRENSIRLMDKMIQVHLSVLVSRMCFFFFFFPLQAKFCKDTLLLTRGAKLHRNCRRSRETSAGTSGLTPELTELAKYTKQIE